MTEVFAGAIAWLVSNYVLAITVYVAGGAFYAWIKWVIELFKLKGDIAGVEDRARIVSQRFTSYEYPPTAKNNKGLLTFWAVFWPFNLVWTLFADVAKGIWNFLYRVFGSMFDAIAKAILPN